MVSNTTGNANSAALSTTTGAGLDHHRRAYLRERLNAQLAGLADNTRAAYGAALNRLDRETPLGDLAAMDAPERDRELAAHVDRLHGAGLAPASIRLHVAAARMLCRALDLEPPGRGSLTASTLRRIGREGRSRGRGQAAPLSWRQADLAAGVAANGGGSVLGLRDAALVAVASDAMLRVSELVALDCADVVQEPDGSGRLHVRSSKTDQEGRGAVLFLGPPTMQRLSAWMAAAGISAGPLFRRVRRGGVVGSDRLTVSGARLGIKRAASAAGLDPRRISGHSARIGAAQSLARRGAGLVEMQQAGRWTSATMPARYARAQLAERGAVARLRYRA